MHYEPKLSKSISVSICKDVVYVQLKGTVCTSEISMWALTGFPEQRIS